MSELSGIPLVAAGVLPPGPRDQEWLEGLVATGLGFTAIEALLAADAAAGRVRDDEQARRRGALLEWAIALIALDTEDHDDHLAP
jgi:hypothetical protein